MALLNFRKKAPAPVSTGEEVDAFLKGFSIEVMPRTAANVEDFRTLLPAGTRVYIAHIEGTPIEDMVFGGWDVPLLHRGGFELGDWVLAVPHWGVVALQMLTFVLKLAVLIWFQLMIRWTLPRFRYDQIMKVCWQYMLPLSLLNILVTGIVILLLQ